MQDDLSGLTFQQTEFVRYMLEGMTASKAYSLAYNTENMSQNSIWCEASKLKHNPKVAQCIVAGRKQLLNEAVPTLHEHCQDMKALREEARNAGNHAAAIQAETMRGKVAGHYVERVDLSVSKHDTTTALEAIAQHSPEFAAQLAAKHNIPWQPGQSTKH